MRIPGSKVLRCPGVILMSGLAGVFGLAVATAIHAQQGGSVAVDPDDIGGVVQGPSGPEAGVWVIAETSNLPTRLRKIVVTDDRGRFVVPDLPQAEYRMWVRGYGLVDSSPVVAARGRTVTLTAVPAPNSREAAKIYPANYWYSLVEPPATSEFPGTGEAGNGISTNLRTQAAWIDVMKQGCQLCHQMGSPMTRTLEHLRDFDSSVAAWDHRVQLGQRGANMSNAMTRFGRARGLEMYADWTDRIAAGEVPPAPPRPAGVERNLVLTMWVWGGPNTYMHDMVSTDKRQPTVNAGGPIYGVSYSHDMLAIVDPVAHSATEIKVPLRDDPETVPSTFPQSVAVPSIVWGDEIIWTNRANPHNPMIDGEGRVWITTEIRSGPNPDWCQQGSSHPSARFYPLERSGRQAGFYDPKTNGFTLIDTCFGTHHLQFAEDEDDTLYFSSLNETVGWIKTRVYDETGDEATSQGWCPMVIDANGDGRITKPWSEPAEPVTARMDALIRATSYGIITSPVDDAVWIGSTGPFPGRIVRLEPATCKAEVYEPPFANPAAPDKHGFSPRGIDIDRNGVVWTALSGSGQTASFDRRKCRVLNGPTATGQHCPEGWTLYPAPGPTLKGVRDPGSADFHYYNWVDQFNTLGLGENVPITNGSGSDSLLALLPDTGAWVVLRVPYPLNFFSRGVDGRIDDPSAGWKGRGLWANYGSNTLWHAETGKGTLGAVVHFQMRPDPLAK